MKGLPSSASTPYCPAQTWSSCSCPSNDFSKGRKTLVWTVQQRTGMWKVAAALRESPGFSSPGESCTFSQSGPLWPTYSRTIPQRRGWSWVRGDLDGEGGSRLHSVPAPPQHSVSPSGHDVRWSDALPQHQQHPVLPKLEESVRSDTNRCFKFGEDGMAEQRLFERTEDFGLNGAAADRNVKSGCRFERKSRILQPWRKLAAICLILEMKVSCLYTLILAYHHHHPNQILTKSRVCYSDDANLNSECLVSDISNK
jgi:hypothetical protein